MIGAIIGDTIGSSYEFHNVKSKEFDLFTANTTPTDDSYMTMAVMETILTCHPIDYSNKGIEKFKKELIENFVKWFKRHPNGGYGLRFESWCLGMNNYQPYNSFGNGSAMRISPVGFYCNSEEEVKKLSKAVAEVTHSHVEGIKGAECIAMCIYLARKGKSKEEIKQYVIDNYYERLKNLNYNSLVAYYSFDETCQGSCAEAVYCFLISNDFEDCLRTSISIGGDSDTIACMSCAIAEAYYKDVPSNLISQVKSCLSEDMKDMIEKFDRLINR